MIFVKLRINRLKIVRLSFKKSGLTATKVPNECVIRDKTLNIHPQVDEVEIKMGKSAKKYLPLHCSQTLQVKLKLTQN